MKLNLIYDGNCRFCKTTAGLIKSLDWLKRFTFIPFQDENVYEKFPKLSKETCEKEIYLILEKENTTKYFAGYDAFKTITSFLPMTFLLSWILFLPGVSHCGKSIYKVVAKNRYRASSCKSEK